MNIFDIYLDKIKKLAIKLNKENVIEIPESLNGINVDVPPPQFDCDISTNVAMVLSKLNQKSPIDLANQLSELIKKDTTIFDLRGKILELNNILSISEEAKIAQQAEIQSLSQKISALEIESTESIESLVSKIANLEKEKQQLAESADAEILEARLKASSTLEQVAFLTNEIEVLKNEINILNSALEASELDVLTKKLKIEDLGEP